MLNMRRMIVRTIVSILLMCLLITPLSYAQPYGIGKYGIITYGNLTSLSINTSGNINITNITPTDSGTLGTGTSTVTVTSTDVVGYKLYIQALNGITYMNNLGTHLDASANAYPSSTNLSTNTWGFNTDSSSNFAGITNSDVQIDSVTGPITSGHITSIKYGVNINTSKPAGNYSAQVVYTAVPQTN